MDSRKPFLLVGVIVTLCLCANGCEYCGCYGTPNCDCYCPPWMYIGYDKIILNPAQGQVSVSSSAAASVKYNKGAPQAYISSLSSAKADPKLPVHIVSPTNPPPVAPTNQPTAGPTAPVSKPTSSPTAKKQDWDYRPSDTAYGPANWKLLAPRCGGTHQSPIEIHTESAIQKGVNLKLQPLAGDDSMKANLVVQGKLKNNGRALGFTVDSNKTPIKLQFNQMYTLKQFHFHVGCENEMGSEHALDGKRFPGEIHLIFTNDKYPSVKDAMQAPDGLLGIAFFLATDETAANAAFKRIDSKMNVLRMPQGVVDFSDGLSLTNMIPALKEGLANLKVFAYRGSIPTPPCFESVTWFVFRRPVKINGVTLESWRNHLQAAHGRMCGNFRPLQPLNNRKILTFAAGAAPLATTAKPSGSPSANSVPGSASPSPKPSVSPSAIPSGGAIAGAQQPSASVEKAANGMGLKQKAYAQLLGNAGKLPDAKHTPADARMELHPAQPMDAGNLRTDNILVPQANGNPMQGPSSAFTKVLPGAASKLNLENKKGVDASSTQSFKTVENGLGKNNQGQVKKPTVAPGMKRQSI